MEESKGFKPIYYLHDKLDEIVDEKGSQFIAFRKVQWAKKPEEPKDSTKAHYEIRKWRVDENQEETPNKGVVFMTEQGPHNCVTAMLQSGFGDTKKCLNILKQREDFKDSVEHMYDEDDTSDKDGEFFDARELLLYE